MEAELLTAIPSDPHTDLKEESNATQQTVRPKSSSILRSVAILLFVWIVSGIYTDKILMRGWIPHDDGALAQSAERVLSGQLPHRDFVEIYTGGLSYLNAFAFRLFGVNFHSLRLMMFLFFLSWIPAVYLVARELVPDWFAGGLTLLAVVWSVPNYTVPMPSWYNLFFATFGVAALFCYVKRASLWWLFIAGLCGGTSFLIKSVGLYYVAGVLLFFVYQEQSKNQKSGQPGTKTSFLYSGFVTVSLLGFLGIIASLVRRQFGIAEVIHFFVPAAAVVVLLILREWMTRSRLDDRLQSPAASDAVRFARLLKLSVPFLAGVFVPVVLFLIPYYRAGALADFLHGVFTLPAKRMLGAFMHPPDLVWFLPALFLAVTIFISFQSGKKARTILAIVVSALLEILLIDSFNHSPAYQILWNMVREMIPVLAICGAAALFYFQRTSSPPSEQTQQRIMILLSLCATCSLVQFPFAGPIYFCYVAPLALLASAAILGAFPKPPYVLLASVGTVALLFPILIVRSGGLLDLGWSHAPNQQTELLKLPRAGGLRVTIEREQQYDKAIPLLQAHAGGRPILAAPDCPEVYFLGNFENPTGTMFEIFEEPAGYQERIDKLVEDKQIKAILINNDPGFSEYYVDPLENIADDKFPFTQNIGTFEVRWRQ
jgi:hypothetical protein